MQQRTMPECTFVATAQCSLQACVITVDTAQPSSDPCWLLHLDKSCHSISSSELGAVCAVIATHSMQQAVQQLLFWS